MARIEANVVARTYSIDRQQGIVLGTFSTSRERDDAFLWTHFRICHSVFLMEGVRGFESTTFARHREAPPCCNDHMREACQ